MPFTVQDLIEDKPNPISVNRSDTAQVALDRMIEGDYSQLPVVSDDNKVDGIVTSDSIVRALNHFDLTIKELYVIHALQPVKSFDLEDDLFELLDYLKDAYAVVVVDNNKALTGIVTNYDTTEYFRRRGEDIMLVEDIESMLKEYILATFQNKDCEIDESALTIAIEEITPSDAKFRKEFKKALNLCLDFDGIDKTILDRTKIEDTFTNQLSPKQPPKPFDRLTLGEYIDLFLNKKRWNKYKPIFKLDSEACRKILDPVREIRNALAHFRADLTPQQREQLRFCKEWLSRHQQEITDTFSPKDIELVKEKDKITETVIVGEPVFYDFLHNFYLNTFKDFDWTKALMSLPPQLIEQPSSTESKYAELATFLQSAPLEKVSITLAFSDIEKIINAELPKTAREHRSWWANDSVGHVQSKQWLEVGWRVSSVNISQERVTFSRIKHREQDYIKFFSDLLADLRERKEFNVKDVSPAGRNYITVGNIRSEDNKQLAALGFSFARGKKFRVELYIDSGVDETNEIIFNQLFSNRWEIEALIGRPLSWEHLADRRASRIATYYEGSITDESEHLTYLRDLAVETIIRFHRVFNEDFREKFVVLGNEIKGNSNLSENN